MILVNPGSAKVLTRDQPGPTVGAQCVVSEMVREAIDRESLVRGGVRVRQRGRQIDTVVPMFRGFHSSGFGST